MCDEREPKPCPFCGSPVPAMLDEYGLFWYAHCENPDCPCNPETGGFESKLEAIDSWNNRDKSSQLKEQKEAFLVGWDLGWRMRHGYADNYFHCDKESTAEKQFNEWRIAKRKQKKGKS